MRTDPADVEGVVDPNDPLGLSREQRRQQTLRDVATHLDTAQDIATVRVGIAPGEAHIIGRDEYCPARLPCLGRPAVRFAVPVHLESTGAQQGEVTGTYCPLCRAWKADQPRTGAWPPQGTAPPTRRKDPSA